MSITKEQWEHRHEIEAQIAELEAKAPGIFAPECPSCKFGLKCPEHPAQAEEKQ